MTTSHPGFPGVPDEPGAWAYRHPVVLEAAIRDRAAARAEEADVYGRKPKAAR